MYKKIIWPLILVSASLLFLLFASGFVTSLVISRSEEPEEALTEEETPAFMEEPTDPSLPMEDISDILVLGDSLGAGVGDEEDLGFGQRYVNLVEQSTGENLSLNNLSVPGYVSSELAEQITSGTTDADIAQAQLIMISIGGNDLNPLYFEDEATMSLEFDGVLEAYLNDLTLILEEIRSLNPEAQLALIGLYNPYSSDDPDTARYLLEWNHQTRLVANTDPRIAYIPTYEFFQFNLETFLSFDRFHPSGAGYQSIAESIYKVLN
ncbi:Acylhydrolase with GDSL-like protein [Alkalibacterium sp. AK22]|uniref:GDSL-type esterase/lipase family protein n=1 Tax=Alkalibacterium sp. AK22 TaxID=1229520 RepID=UPI00044950A8|nr:GDSL-type esterase/lipase family protein [Alkalibacterium sp. AK22]EXJ23075.1 Acylhydrolase with GDSL-like protein [Alkalibacterium sp. AK22]